MRQRIMMGVITLALVTLGASTVLAQGPGGGDGPGSDRTGDTSREERRAAHKEQRAQRREQMRQRMRTIRIARLTEELSLDPETAIRLMPLLDRLDEVQRTRRERTQQLHQDVQAMLAEGGGSAEAVSGKIDEFWTLEEDLLRERRKAFEDIGKLIGPQQQARLMVFLPQFKREVQQLVRIFRQGQEGRRGHHRRRDGGDRQGGRRGGRDGAGGFGGPGGDDFGPQGGPPPEEW